MLTLHFGLWKLTDGLEIVRSLYRDSTLFATNQFPDRIMKVNSE